MTISVDFDLLLRNKLKIEEYFVLFCLVNHLDEDLVKYIDLTGNVTAGLFQRLQSLGYVVLKDENNITFETIILTEHSKQLFGVNNSDEFEPLFKELLSTYPNKVKRLTGGTRRLHNNLDGCRKTYKLTLMSIGKLNINLHKKIMLCIRMYHQEHLKDNKVEFMQLLSTFLNQKTWEQYLEEVTHITDLPKPTTTVDAI
jgi:hypothetical protein